MKRVYKTKEKRKLKPGEFHSFLVLNLVQLPDGSDYFVLADKFGDKHLLLSKYYKNYPIRLNSYYLCHIDKINCQGRIFLEPVHPFYKPGEVYNFKFKKTISLCSKNGKKKSYGLMIGETGDRAYLSVNDLNTINSEILIPCKILQIKKAKIFLESVVS